MKTTKKLLFIILSAGALNSWIACNNSSTTASGDTNSGKNGRFVNKSDSEFVMEAANINLEEISLGQLAESKASMTETKQLAQMMITDHTKSNSDLSALASKKSITIPTTMNADAQKDYNNLSQKTGMAFDKAYCDMMVEGHKEAIKKFEKESKDGKDPDIQAWATNTLPTLRKHLQNAKDCQQKTTSMK